MKKRVVYDLIKINKTGKSVLGWTNTLMSDYGMVIKSMNVTSYNKETRKKYNTTRYQLNILDIIQNIPIIFNNEYLLFN